MSFMQVLLRFITWSSFLEL